MSWLIIAPKILAVVLAATVISKSYVDFRTRIESLALFVFWSAAWVLIVVVALYPPIVDIGIAYFGRGTGVGTFLGMAIVLLFFLFTEFTRSLNAWNKSSLELYKKLRCESLGTDASNEKQLAFSFEGTEARN